MANYLAEGNGFRSDRPVIHKEALIRLLRALGGDTDMEDTGQILDEMNVKEKDEITMCELFDQYTRRGRKEGKYAAILVRNYATTCIVPKGTCLSGNASPFDN